MKTYQADEAIAKFRTCFDSAGLEYEFINSDVNTVRCNVTRGDVTLCTWFDVTKQVWGFDLLQGGQKVCDQFEAFEDYLGTYLLIHTVFIPNTKIVTDAFEKEFGITTVYDSFSGNKQKGYTAKFKVLGNGDQNVLVQRIPEGYLVRLVVPDDMSPKFKVRAEYKYELSESGEVTPIPTIHLYTNRIMDKYADDASAQIQRVGDSVFSFSIDGLVITAEVQFNYMEIRYHITEVGCYDADLMVSPDNPYDLSAVYMACKDFYDDCVAGEDDDAPAGESETVFAGDSDAADAAGFDSDSATDDDEVDEFGAGCDEAIEVTGAGCRAEIDAEDAEELAQEEAAAVSGDGSQDYDDLAELEPNTGVAAEPEEPDEVPKKGMQLSGLTEEVATMADEPVRETGSCGGTMSVDSIKLVVEDGKNVGVQFIVDGNPHIFGVDAVKAAGLPVKRIKQTVSVINKCGMRMTEDELRLKKYSEDYSGSNELLAEIVNAVFA